jgi:hypothetical protein
VTVGVVRLFFILILFVGTSAGLFGNDTAPRLFESEEVLELMLTQNIDVLENDVDDVRAFHPAQLSYAEGNGREVVLKVGVRTRGKTRRNPQLCDSPPLVVKFDDAETNGTVFRGQRKLKLVTHCKRRKDIYEQYLLREYLVYRVYNILTSKSFRVRLVRVRYVDSGGRYRPVTRYAFFIEDEKDMAVRNNGKPDETTYKYWVFQKKEGQILVSLFQFMIGNTDWSIPGRHNVKIIRAGEEASLYAVPYDFDMSGIVDARYARPHEKLQGKIKDVRSRLYRGLCRKQEEFTPVFAIFKQKKTDIYELYRQFPYLDGRNKKSALRYLEEFYRIIDTPRLVKKYLVENCRKLE